VAPVRAEGHADHRRTATTMAMQALPPGSFYFNWHERLGAGGLGYVDRIVVTASNCLSNPVGCERAVKRLNDKFVAHPEMQARFEREIGTLYKFDHPNIVTCVGENLPESTKRFYVMPLYRSSVRRHIASGGKCGDWSWVATQGAVLADAMAYAHSKGVVHRDLKPDNVLFNGNESLKIADWGYGGFIHRHSVVLEELTRGGMGTAYYVSIEQWSTGKCDERGDIYSLGMMLDEWVTGSQRQITIGMGLAGADTTAEWTTGARLFNATLKQMTQVFAAGRTPNMSVVAAELRRAASL
jgi:serine/threonine protein kinase